MSFHDSSGSFLADELENESATDDEIELILQSKIIFLWKYISPMALVSRSAGILACPLWYLQMKPITIGDTKVIKYESLS